MKELISPKIPSKPETQGRSLESQSQFLASGAIRNYFFKAEQESREIWIETLKYTSYYVRNSIFERGVF